MLFVQLLIILLSFGEQYGPGAIAAGDQCIKCHVFFFSLTWEKKM